MNYIFFNYDKSVSCYYYYYIQSLPGHNLLLTAEPSVAVMKKQKTTKNKSIQQKNEH